MTTEVRPLGVSCNIGCLYCYQEPTRMVSRLPKYDLVKIKDAVINEGGPFTLFGGEPLLLPLTDLEDLWSWGHARYGGNCIQTNGTLVSDEHIRLFHKYRVMVGISIDGPGELNDARWHGTLERTRKSTGKTEAVIDRLCAEGLYPGIIVTLHRVNAASHRLPILLEWARHLAERGVRQVRLHLLEAENEAIRNGLGLSVEENIQALSGFLELNDSVGGDKFDIFRDMRNLLLGDDRKVGCVWNGCDPYTTTAVRGIDGQGQRTNCGRTNKDGVEFEKSIVHGFERYVALYNTPQNAGGCKDCRFFLMCKGQCPGTAINGDWRYRTEHCEVWKSILELMERRLEMEGKTPLSLSPKRIDLERSALALWAHGRRPSLARLSGLSHAEKA